jgi:hypothetical protein
MASIKVAYDTTGTLTWNASAATLAASATVGQVCTEVDNTTTLYVDVLVLPKITIAASGTITGQVEFYLLSSADGTTYSGDTSYSGTNGSYTLGAAGSPNPTYFGALKMHALSGAYTGAFSIVRALGYMPSWWAVVVINNSGGAAFTACSAQYRGLTYTSA